MARANFHWDDPLLLDEQLTEEEKMVRDAARDYAQGRLEPRVVDAFRREHTDPAISERWGTRIIGRHHCGGIRRRRLNYVSYGLIAREWSGSTRAIDP